MSVSEIVSALNGVIWSPALIYLCLGVGLYFSLRTRFMQVRGLGQMIKLMFHNKSSEAGVSSFQALAMSLSGRVGTGRFSVFMRQKGLKGHVCRPRVVPGHKA